jgi:hypothetical protein
MHRLTTDLLSQACRIFLTAAYPGGEGAVPAKKRGFLSLPAGQSLLDLLPDHAALNECCQVLRKNGDIRAVLVRLGASHYPHLKLKAQLVDHDQGDLWLFSVDTHDAFTQTCFLPPPGHPEAAAWAQLQAQNAVLKERIEAAWDKAGLMTFNSLLRRDLDQRRPSFA